MYFEVARVAHIGRIISKVIESGMKLEITTQLHILK